MNSSQDNKFAHWKSISVIFAIVFTLTACNTTPKPPNFDQGLSITSSPEGAYVIHIAYWPKVIGVTPFLEVFQSDWPGETAMILVGPQRIDPL
jgi:hypothetical protein